MMNLSPRTVWDFQFQTDAGPWNFSISAKTEVEAVQILQRSLGIVQQELAQHPAARQNMA